jgi:hypothetical protein
LIIDCSKHMLNHRKGTKPPKLCLLFYIEEKYGVNR